MSELIELLLGVFLFFSPGEVSPPVSPLPTPTPEYRIERQVEEDNKIFIPARPTVEIIRTCDDRYPH